MESPAAVPARREEAFCRRRGSGPPPVRASPPLLAERACRPAEDPLIRDDEPEERPPADPRAEERAEPAGRGRSFPRPLAEPPLLPLPPPRPCAMRPTVPPGSHPSRERPARPMACPGVLAHRLGAPQLAPLRWGRPLVCASQIMSLGVMLFARSVRRGGRRWRHRRTDEPAHGNLWMGSGAPGPPRVESRREQCWGLGQHLTVMGSSGTLKASLPVVPSTSQRCSRPPSAAQVVPAAPPLAVRTARTARTDPVPPGFGTLISSPSQRKPSVSSMRTAWRRIRLPTMPARRSHQGRPRRNRRHAAGRIRCSGECRFFTRRAPLTAGGRWSRHRRWR